MGNVGFEALQAREMFERVVNKVNVTKFGAAFDIYGCCVRAESNARNIYLPSLIINSDLNVGQLETDDFYEVGFLQANYSDTKAVGSYKNGDNHLREYAVYGQKLLENQWPMNIDTLNDEKFPFHTNDRYSKVKISNFNENQEKNYKLFMKDHQKSQFDDKISVYSLSKMNKKLNACTWLVIKDCKTQDFVVLQAVYWNATAEKDQLDNDQMPRFTCSYDIRSESRIPNCCFFPPSNNNDLVFRQRALTDVISPPSTNILFNNNWTTDVVNF